MPAYVAALCTELDQVGRGCPAEVHTIFFGGGTPSLLPLPLLQQIFASIHRSYRLTPDVEITLEANPGTLNREYLDGLLGLGINRLSLGVQSANPSELQLLEREHDYPDVIRAVAWARSAGIRNLNLDLIFGLPYQHLESWKATLELALGLAPEHFSLYNLILEHGTPLNAWVERGLLSAPDDDRAADMYEWALARMAQAGYRHYEISNWARQSGANGLLACRHNLQYWRGEPYLGIGAGAHGYAAQVRTANVRAPQAYIDRQAQGAPRPFPRSAATVNVTPIAPSTAMRELMMVGFRLLEEGIPRKAFQRLFGCDPWDIFAGELSRLQETGLVESTPDCWRLTPRGVMLGNQVFMQFV